MAKQPVVRRAHYVPREQDVEIGNRIRHLRVNILSVDRQVDFAEALGVTRGAVGNWELGRGVSRDNIAHIARTFNVSVDWLAAGMGAPTTVGSVPPFIQRMKLLPPEDLERFTFEVDALLDVHLHFLQRKSVGAKRRSRKVNKPES